MTQEFVPVMMVTLETNVILVLLTTMAHQQLVVHHALV